MATMVNIYKSYDKKSAKEMAELIYPNYTLPSRKSSRIAG